MPVKINVNNAQLKNKLEHPLNENQMEMLASQILRDCNKYCKKDTGTLIASSQIHSRLKQGLLIWQTPYAARQYYEIQTANKESNADASWRWCEVAKQLHKADWVRQAQNIVRYYG